MDVSGTRSTDAPDRADFPDRIELRGLQLVGIVGVLPEERERAQPLDVDVDIEVDADTGAIVITCEARCYGRTGVEMEAMTGASVGALTVYDMVKGVERGAFVEEVVLLEKRGGKSGYWRRGE